MTFSTFFKTAFKLYVAYEIIIFSIHKLSQKLTKIYITNTICTVIFETVKEKYLQILDYISNVCYHIAK